MAQSSAVSEKMVISGEKKKIVLPLLFNAHWNFLTVFGLRFLGL